VTYSSAFKIAKIILDFICLGFWQCVCGDVSNASSYFRSFLYIHSKQANAGSQRLLYVLIHIREWVLIEGCLAQVLLVISEFGKIPISRINVFRTE
jgi:hypothetical protein